MPSVGCGKTQEGVRAEQEWVKGLSEVQAAQKNGLQSNQISSVFRGSMASSPSLPQPATTLQYDSHIWG